MLDWFNGLPGHVFLACMWFASTALVWTNYRTNRTKFGRPLYIFITLCAFNVAMVANDIVNSWFIVPN